MFLWVSLTNIIIFSLPTFLFSYLVSFTACNAVLTLNWVHNEFLPWWISFIWTTNDFLHILPVIAIMWWASSFRFLWGSFWRFFCLTIILIVVIHETLLLSFIGNHWFYDELAFVSNIFLNNQLNKIHPPLFYILIGYILYRVIFPLKRVNRSTHISHSILINMGLILLTLGGWWAFQEGTWGGWWNWDASEVLGFLILVILINNTHIALFAKINFFRQTTLFWQKLSTLMTMLAFTSLQLSFISSSHSFGIEFSFLFARDNLLLVEQWVFVITTRFVWKNLITITRSTLIPLTIKNKNYTERKLNIKNSLAITLFLFSSLTILPFLWLYQKFGIINWIASSSFYILQQIVLSITVLSLTLMFMWMGKGGSLLLSSYAISPPFSLLPLLWVLCGQLRWQWLKNSSHFFIITLLVFNLIFNELLPPIYDSCVFGINCHPSIICNNTLLLSQINANSEELWLFLINFDSLFIFPLIYLIIIMLNYVI